MKSPILNISNDKRKRYTQSPETVLNVVKKLDTTIKQEIKTLQAATRISAYTPLVDLSERLGKNTQVDLIYFETENENVTLRFKAERDQDMKTMLGRIRDLGLKNINITYQEGKTDLEVKYQKLP